VYKQENPGLGIPGGQTGIRLHDLPCTGKKFQQEKPWPGSNWLDEGQWRLSGVWMSGSPAWFILSQQKNCVQQEKLWLGIPEGQTGIRLAEIPALKPGPL
jgi:hypothetical protein